MIDRDQLLARIPGLVTANVGTSGDGLEQLGLLELNLATDDLERDDLVTLTGVLADLLAAITSHLLRNTGPDEVRHWRWPDAESARDDIGDFIRRLIPSDGGIGPTRPAQ